MSTLTKEQFDEQMKECYCLACQVSGAVDELLHNGFFQERDSGGNIMMMVQKSLNELYEKIDKVMTCSL